MGTQSTLDPPATTYIVTGSAGNIEDHEPFTRPAPKRSAKRLNTYGWSKMVVHNATHLLWQQIQTDSGAPASTWGKVMDETWIVQNHHGPFAQHPRTYKIWEDGLSGLRPEASEVDVHASAIEGYATPSRPIRCRHVNHG